MVQYQRIGHYLDRSIRAYPYCSAVVVGLFLGGGLLFSVGWWTSLVGVIGFVHLVSTMSRRCHVGGVGVVVWTISAAMSLSWFWSTYPLDWLSIPAGPVQVVFIGVYWLTSALWLGLAGGVCALALYYLLQTNRSIVLGGVPVVWVGSEVVGSWIFTLFTYGPGGVWSPYFSFSYVGYALAEHTLFFHIAAWAGVYGLSFTMVAGGVAVWCAVRAQWSLRVISGVVVVTVATGYTSVDRWFIAESPPSLRVAVVETYFDAAFRSQPDHSSRQGEAVVSGVRWAHTFSPDYILLPEDTGFLHSYQSSGAATLALRQLFGTSSVQLIDSGQIEWNGTKVVRGYVYDNATMQIDHADKQYLTPQGEYIPVAHATVARWFGYGDVMAGLSENIRYVPGPSRSQADFSAATPAILFCFASASPWGVRSIVSERTPTAPFVAHPLSHAWFNTPYLFWHQLDTMLRVQARWNQVPIVSAGNMAPSKLYTASGAMIEVTPQQPPIESPWWNVRVFDL